MCKFQKMKTDFNDDDDGTERFDGKNFVMKEPSSWISQRGGPDIWVQSLVITVTPRPERVYST